MTARRPIASIAQVTGLQTALDGVTAASRGLLDTASADSSVVLQVLSDSTANDTTDWPYVLAQKFAAANPTWTVRHRLYNSSTGKYPAPTVIQTGSSGLRSARLDGSTNTAQGEYGGTSLYSPHSSALTITGDIDVRVKLSMDDWSPATPQAFIGKNGAAGNRGWYFYHGGTFPVFVWSVDGTNFVANTRAQAAYNPTDGSANWVRAALDVDNGSGGWSLEYYTSADGEAWTQLGATVTGSGVTSIFATTQRLEVGAANGGLLLIGNVYEADIRSSIDGPSLLPPLADLWARKGNTAFVGGPVLDIYNGSVAGYGMTSMTANLAAMTPIAGQSLTIVSCSHNDQGELGPLYLARWDSLLAAIKARLPMSAVMLMSQNPRNDAANAFSDAHHLRRHLLASWAGRNDVGYVDIYPAFIAAGLSNVLSADGIHPSTTGSTLWADTVYAAMTVGR